MVSTANLHVRWAAVQPMKERHPLDTGNPGHKEGAWVKWHLQYGFFTGGYANYQTMLNRPAMAKYVPIIKQLQAAGWEPMPDAWSSDPKVTLERFGRKPNGYVIVTVHNTTDTEGFAS